MDPVLLEREDVLAALTGLLAEIGAGRGRLAFIGGEAGVGKTSVVTAFADAVEVPVRRGGCDNLTTAEALAPFTEAVPELLAVLDRGPVQRARLWQAVRSALGDGPSVLVLEDVHWADGASLDLVRLLARRLSEFPVLVLATYRVDEIAPSHPLAVVLGDLATTAGVVRMRVPPLTRGAVAALVRRAGAALDPEQVLADTGGN